MHSMRYRSGPRLRAFAPDGVINEMTGLPRHYTPAEMKAAAERDTRVRREGNVNLLAVMRETGVRRYVLESSGFWYAPGPGLADESSLLAVDAFTRRHRRRSHVR